MTRKVWLLLTLLWLSPPALGNDAMWKLLEAGSRIVLIRHTITPPGVGDPAGFRLDDCGTQRNLTDAGRAHARAIGEAFRTRKIPVDRVLSSLWCRCLETARLAFARAEPSAALGDLYSHPENRTRQVEAMRALVAGHRGPGNLVLVTHNSTIVALADTSVGTGEMVILTRRGEGFAVDGRLTVPGP